MTLKKIVSGGQTGVDRAALDAAIALGVPHEGWCPLGRRAEDGRIDDRYQLRETASKSYAVRTRQNVRDSDGTLILYVNELTGGTALTKSAALSLDKPLFEQRLTAPIEPEDVSAVCQWIVERQIESLNVAGPRESTHPKITRLAGRFMEMMLSHLLGSET